LVAGRLSRLAAVAANTFRETVRERVLYNLVFFAILMTLSGLLLGELSIRQDEKIIKDIGLAAMDVFGTLIAIFIGVGLVNKEIERRSLYPLLAKPLDRGEFFLGKFAGLALTLLVNIGVMAAGIYAALWLAGRGPGGVLILKGVFAIYMSLLLVVALAMCFSTLTSSAMAAVGTVAVVVAGRFSDVVRNMREVAPGVPGWVTTVLYYVLPNFRNFDFKDRVAYGDPLPLPALGWVTFYGACYTALLLGVGLWAFRRRDLN
jgi:ABC-type transport system involved in multi-copper enzyme maturation permease subunit